MKPPRKWRRRLFSAACLAFAALMLFVAARRPSLTREWDEDVAVLAGVRVDEGGIVHLSNVRDWSYTEDSVTARRYFDAAYDPSDIRDVWMYEQILASGGLIAHTFLVFEFGGGAVDDMNGADAGSAAAAIDSAGFPSAPRYLGLSVETRRQAGEEYSIVGGMLRKFEITHIWATEDDLVRRRVVHLDYPLTRYRLLIPEDVRGQIFARLARETASLAESPRWYNTATNNCTSSLVQYVNGSIPGAIPWHYSHVLTGRIDNQLTDLGYLDRGSAEYITKDRLAEEGVR